MRIRIRGFCSKEQKPFFIVADVTGDLMRWIGASPLPPVVDRDFYAVGNYYPNMSLRVEASEWHCPICNSTRNEKIGLFWLCHTCNEYHCVGTNRGLLHGRCGKCRVDPATLVKADIFGVIPVSAEE